MNDEKRYCTLCGHFQLLGDTCEKCLVDNPGWSYDDF